jgi:hypothetical protein
MVSEKNKRRLEALEAGTPRPPSREELVRAICVRIIMFIGEEASELRAPRFQRAKDPQDRVLPPEAERLWGPDYTRAQCYEEAVRRVFDNLEDILSRPYGTDGNLLPFMDPEDLTPEGKARFREMCGIRGSFGE